MKYTWLDLLRKLLGIRPRLRVVHVCPTCNTQFVETLGEVCKACRQARLIAQSLVK